jgi:hypothetical protein
MKVLPHPWIAVLDIKDDFVGQEMYLFPIGSRL